MSAKKLSVLDRVIAYFVRYLAFPSPDYPFVAALYCAATYMFQQFDAFGYLVITADTKRAGKSRLMELIGFVAANTRQIAGMTVATLFHIVKEEQPTLLMDEAESISGEMAGTMRSFLNVGYRQGATIPRMGKGGVEHFPAYCPKVFVLIGDMFDTLRDRSIMIRMRRADAPERFVRAIGEGDGNALGADLQDTLKEKRDAVLEAYARLKLDFLNDRDEEIWLPLFAVCTVLAPDRVEELKRIAVDMAAEKTQGIARYTTKADDEEAAQANEYAERALADLHSIMNRGNIYTEEAVTAMKNITTGPWRKYKGDEGLNSMHLANLLAQFKVTPTLIRSGKKGTKTEKVARGYRFDTVDAALKSVRGGK